MTKKSNYWAKRFEQLEDASHRYGMNTYKSIEPVFDRALSNINKEIDSWYGRFADNNKITMAEAKRILNGKELKELKWDIDDYIKYGRENAVDEKWMKQLENASARYHVTRLEALKLRTQQAAEVAFGNELDQMDKLARHVYSDSYYHSIFELQKGFNLGWEIGQIDEKKLSKVIVRPWTADGKNFSTRIWNDKNGLISEVHKQLTQTCILGKGPDDAIKAISKKFNVSKNQAGRLIMTEQAYFHSVAQKDAFAQLDVEEFEVVATLDSHTSAICQEMDGKHFPMKDYDPGITAPPFHPWCRSVTAPYFSDDEGERFARDEDGKTYYVPSNITYPQWKSVFVDKEKTIDEALKTVEKTAKVALELSMYPKSFSATKAEAKNTQALMDYINSCDDANPDTVKLYSNMAKMDTIESKGIPFKIKHTKSSAVGYSSNRFTGELVEAEISYPKLKGDNLSGQVATTLHEQMHLIDLYNRNDEGQWFSAVNEKLHAAFKNANGKDVKMSDKTKELFDSFKEEYDKIHKNLGEAYQKDLKKLYDDFWGLERKSVKARKQYQKDVKKLKRDLDDNMNYECRNILGGGVTCLEDIYDALSGGRFRDSGTVIYGHGSSYYRNIGVRCEETLANYGALSVMRPDLIEYIRNDYPDVVETLEEIVKEMLEKVGE